MCISLFVWFVYICICIFMTCVYNCTSVFVYLCICIFVYKIVRCAGDCWYSWPVLISAESASKNFKHCTASKGYSSRTSQLARPTPSTRSRGLVRKKRNSRSLGDALRKIHLAKIQFGKWNPKAVGHSVQKIYPVVPRTLCTGPETEWKYESVTGLWRLYSGSWKLYSGLWRLYSEDQSINVYRPILGIYTTLD